jgi:ribosomal protein L40E
MKLAGSFQDAVEVAEQNCKEWIFMGDGDVIHTNEMHEIAKEYDAKTPLEDDELLAVTDDGSIGLMFPHLKEPQWYFVSPAFAVVNILHEDIHKYIISIDDGTKATTFCTSCGAQLRPGSRFCENCGAKNTPQFCENCGAKLRQSAKFCESCGAKV